MVSNSKLYVYKGMIQYLLESTQYDLETIAGLTDFSIKNMESIYQYNQLPSNILAELQLIKLYQIVVELNAYKN